MPAFRKQLSDTAVETVHTALSAFIPKPVCLASGCSHSKYQGSQISSFQPLSYPAALCVPKRLLKALGCLGEECPYLHHYFLQDLAVKSQAHCILLAGVPVLL